MTQTSGPLYGIRILELGSTVAGPAAGRLLADLGADVLKIEPPEGDQLRTWGELAPDGTSWWFKSHNRNKQLLTFDLRQAEDLATVRRIALECDVVIENFRPGWLDERGLGPLTLRAEKPDLIYLSISGYGQTGPYAKRPGYGNIAEAMGGLRFTTGEPDGQPMRLGISISDELAGLYAVVGILAALYARAQDGRGESIDVSLVESTFNLLEAMLPEYVHAGKVTTREGNRNLRAAPNSVYPTADGEWLAIAANGQTIFRRLTALIERPELADDPRFATNQARALNVLALDDIIEAWTRRLDLQAANAALAAAAVPAGPVMSIAAIARDPHFIARGAIASVPDDDGTAIATYAPVPRLSERPARLERAAGRIGRDQQRVLGELGIEPSPSLSAHAPAALNTVTPKANESRSDSLSVTLIDVSARDGLQDEPVFVPTSRKAEVARALAAAGITAIEATSFVHPKWVPQLADADTLIAQLPRGPRYSALIMNRRGLDRGAAAFGAAGYAVGSYDLVFVISASPRHAQHNNNCSIDESLAIFDDIATTIRDQHPQLTLRAAVSCAFVSPWADEPIDGGRVANIIARLVAGGTRLISLCDTVGTADPRTVGRRLAEIRGVFGQLPLSLHLHDAAGYALASIYAGLEHDVRTFEGALGGLGGCPFAPGAQGNLDSEKLARFLADCGARTGIDLDRLAAARRCLQAAVADAVPIANRNTPASASA